MLCLGLLCINCSKAQDISTTDNLISQVNWSGCATYLPTRIWGGTSGGPCPNVGVNGTGINFSYGLVTLAQTIAINQALQGTGLQVNGYNYSWNVKNANINDQQPGSYDPIASITVGIKDKTGKVLENDVYNYGYRLTNWVNFHGTRTFTNPYAASTLGSLDLSVTSKDNQYWAGYYGPEFANFNVSLNYSKAPVPAPPPATATYIRPDSVTPVVIDSTSSPTTVNVGGVELSATGTISAPDGIPQVIKDIQPAAKEDSGSKPSMSLILNTIKQIQAADKAVQAMAVQKAGQQTASSMAASQQQAQQVVESLNAMSMVSAQQFSNSYGFTQNSNNTSVVNVFANSSTIKTTGSNTYNSASIAQQIASISQTNYSVFKEDTRQQEIAQQLPQQSTLKFSGIDSIFDSKQPMTTEALLDQKFEAMKNTVESNELAGGVDLTKMALLPQGYASYTNLALQDAKFYEPKEVYRNQQNVDNVKVLKGLGSDQKHQQMINYQYK